MGKIILTSLLAILLFAPSANLQAGEDQQFLKGKPFSDLSDRIDENAKDIEDNAKDIEDNTKDIGTILEQIEILNMRISALEDPPPELELTFSGDFKQGEGPDMSVQQAWNDFINNATGLFSSIEIKNNLSGSVKCGEPDASSDIANALNSYMVGEDTVNINCGNVPWNVGDFGGTALSAGSTLRVNDCVADASVRPLINNRFWGGIGMTCGAPTQTLMVVLTR